MRSLLSIGRFAQLTRISVSALRFYADVKLLEPALIDPDSSYRYYDPEQVALAERIAALRSVDLPLEEIGRWLSASDEEAAWILERHEQRLFERFQIQREALRSVGRMLNGQRRIPELTIQERDWPAQTLLSVREQVTQTDFWTLRQQAHGEMEGLLEQVNLKATGLPFERYHNREFFGEALETEFCLPISRPIAVSGRVRLSEIAAHRVVCAVHPGDWTTYGSSYAALMHWLEECGPYTVGAAYTILSTGETELGFAVERIPQFSSPPSSILEGTSMNTLDLLDLLHHPDKNQRINTAMALGTQADVSALPTLLERFAEEPDFFVRENLTWAVVRMGAAAVSPLLELLRHPNPAARLQAALTLGKFKDARAVEALVNAVQDPELEVVQRAVHALGQMGDPRAVPVLLNLLTSENDELKNTVRTALEQFGEAAVQPLSAAFPLEDWPVRQQIADILGALGLISTIPALKAALEDERWEVRFSAVTALGTLEDSTARALIQGAAEDVDPRVRGLVSRVLGLKRV